jgi:hypothetical protein
MKITLGDSWRSLSLRGKLLRPTSKAPRAPRFAVFGTEKGQGGGEG